MTSSKKENIIARKNARTRHKLNGVTYVDERLLVIYKHEHTCLNRDYTIQPNGWSINSDRRYTYD